MSLLDEFRAAHDNENSSYYIFHDKIAENLGAVLVRSSIIDRTPWGFVTCCVYRRGDEYVSVTYDGDGPANSDTEYYPDFESVTPEVIQTVIYR